jgi:signal transduction histidine kinase
VTALGKLFRTTVFKISLAYLVIFAIGASLVLGRVGWNVKELIAEQISQTVDADINGLAEQYGQGGIRQLVEVVERRARQPGGSLYLVTTYAGETIAGNVATLPAGVVSRQRLVEVSYQRVGETTANRHALVRTFNLPGGFRLLVGHDLEEGEALRRILGSALVTSLIWLTIIGTLCGLFVARRVLRRVDTINAHARTIVAGDLSSRLPLSGTGDELDRLAQNLNGMLERISELMTGLKEVSDNIAHDLKTPLTRLRNGAEQALRSAQSPDEYRSALEKIIDESDGLIRIFNALLMIARAEAGADRAGMMDFDAATVVKDVGELYEPLAEDNGLSLKIDAPMELPMHGNRELIGQALANLVDNAIKYGAIKQGDESGAAEAVVELTGLRVGETIQIAVADHGPGIEEKDRSRVLDRFVRLENSRSRPGYGLGLSLASAVARLHTGSLKIEDNQPGLRVLLILPALAQKALPPPVPVEAKAHAVQMEASER